MLAAYAINGGPGGGRDDGVDLWSCRWPCWSWRCSWPPSAWSPPSRPAGPGHDARPGAAVLLVDARGRRRLAAHPAGPRGRAAAHLRRPPATARCCFGVPDVDVRPGAPGSFGQPQVYAFAVPVLGIVADIVPVAAGRRPRFPLAGDGGHRRLRRPRLRRLGPAVARRRRRRAAVTSAWASLAVLPLLVLVGGLGRHAASGRPRPGPALAALAALASLGSCWLATLAGAAAVIEPLDLHRAPPGSRARSTRSGSPSPPVPRPASTGGPPRSGGAASGPARRPSSPLLILGGGGAPRRPDLVDRRCSTSRSSRSTSSRRTGRRVAQRRGSWSARCVGRPGRPRWSLVLVAGGAARPRERTAEDDPWGGHTLEWATASPPPARQLRRGPADGDARPRRCSTPTTRRRRRRSHD